MRHPRWTRFGRAVGLCFLGTLLQMFVLDVIAGPAMNVSRTMVAFGQVTLFSGIVQPVFVTNTGDAPLNISTISLSGTHAADFVVGGTCTAPMTLAASGGRCRIDVISSTRTSGNPTLREATLAIQSNASVAAATVNVSAIADSGAPSFLNPSWIDFPAQPAGTSASPQTFTFTNPFDVTFTFDPPLFYRGDGADFAITTDCGLLRASGSCTITIGFVPSATGPRSTELELNFRASDAPTVLRTRRYSVTGVGASGGSTNPAFNLNQRGLTGSWFKPVTGGQGVEIEVFQDLVAPGTGLLQGSWFTYDYRGAGAAASQRWYTFGGSVSAAQPSTTLTLYQNVGGNFNALPTTSAVPVGNVVLGFTDCTHANMAYTFTDGSARSGTIEMVRLTPNVTCSSSGVSTANADFGYSGNWFDPVTSGQGIVLELNSNASLVFFAWYTYAPNGQLQGAAGQRWYTGQASYTPGSRALPLTLYETTGGLFDSAAPAPTTVAVGTAIASFTSCTTMRLAFAFTGGSNAGSSGTINLLRVGPAPSDCGT